MKLDLNNIEDRTIKETINKYGILDLDLIKFMTENLNTF